VSPRPLHKLLIVRLGALGDIVHAIPVAAALRMALPGVRIDWLVSAKHRELLDLVTAVDTCLVVDDRDGARGGGRSLAGTIGVIRRERYDVVIDLQGLIKSAAIARMSGAPRVIGFAARYLREPLARFFYTEIQDPGGAGIYAGSERRHVIEINLGLLQPLGITTTRREFPLRKVDSTVRDEMVQATGGRYALLNPGAAWPNKRWPPVRLAAVAAALRERHALMSVVLWGPGERELGTAVVAGSFGSAVLSPPTSVADIVALARGAEVMVSGDTGPTHIGAAVGTPMVGIYGPTRPERNGPWLADDVTVSRAPFCQCHHLRRCRAERMCLLDVEVADVLAAVERRLAAGPVARG
jgi:lipopolysaccharide heptosyltransferase I